MIRCQHLPIAVALILAALLLAWGCSSGDAEQPMASTESVSDVLEVEAEHCARHNLPVTLCFICDPALREPGRLWCAEHERYEDRCFLCHPELEETGRLWCAEHNLYEDECFLCHPELQDLPASKKAAVTGGLQCKEHDVPESECGICHPELASDLEPGSGLKVRFESARSASLAGVRTARPTAEAGHSETSVLARVTWDQNHYARVTPLAGGVLRAVSADVGQQVRRGDRLATLSSPEIAEIKSTYLAARADGKLKLSILVREQGLVEQRVSAQQELDEAHAAYEVARNRTATAHQILLNFGLSEDAIHRLEETGTPSSDLHVVAPLDGTIVDRHAVVGESVEPGQALFRIVRLDSMWLELSIPERDVSRVVAGQEVVASFDSQPGLQARGRVTWVGSSIDPASRMVKGRAVVANPDRMLRHDMFGHARIGSPRPSETLWVPRDAVQYLDERPFVFTRLADDLYELRRVIIGSSGSGRVAVTDGLGPEDEIVVAHSFTLKSEVLKSRLGAGCVDE